ncbi:MAG TPA: orotidine-5'-phosphate decarboxylase [Longimicrobiaceae bacterium]|nr:orotidine-5'-phosphate decarboxylase [Longimicrobiaceae bacterium]
MSIYSSPTLRPEEEKRRPTPILALDVQSSEDALALIRRVPRASFVKVGLQLFTAAGPDVVRRLRDAGRRVFLDLKLHDIPNTVARAVESSAGLGVELLTLHASGGADMLNAARDAADGLGRDAPQLLAVTVLTSLSDSAVRQVSGRPDASVTNEVVRLARIAVASELDGVVASVKEIPDIRAIGDRGLLILTPGIRLPGDRADDQSRVATPEEAARLGANYIVIGRSVTAAAHPEAAYEAVVTGLRLGISEQAPA